MIKISRFLALIAFATLFCGVNVYAQMPGAPTYVSSAVSVTPASVAAGGMSVVKITVTVSSGFHINSPKPNDPDLIPTTLSVTPVKGLTFGTPVFPAAKTITAPALSQKPLSVFEGTNRITIPVSVAKTAKPGKYKVVVALGYQGCNSSACYPPQTANLTATVSVK